VVEGSWTREGYFQASLILAKHSEEYKAPHDAAEPGYKELIRTLRREQRTDEKAPR
jgi:cytochrome c-type biogenesis protein CcmE